MRELGLLSIVAPLHDEADTVAAFHERALAAVAGLDVELVLVDDGSRDATPALLAQLAAADERVKVVTLSRNFGHQAALSAGLDHARGDVVVMLDGDLACRALTGDAWEIYWGAYLGSPDETLISGPLADVIGQITTARADLKRRKGWIMDTYLLRRSRSAAT